MFAFPQIIREPGPAGAAGVTDDNQRGMTMRQAYKLAALQGWAAGRNTVMAEDSNVGSVAAVCGKYADAMLAEDEEHAKK